jgi:tetratricopeptide (TPR) repeat protein
MRTLSLRSVSRSVGACLQATCSRNGSPPASNSVAPRFTFLLFFASLVVALIAGTTLRAQSVRWDPPSGQLGFNQVSELALVFEECEPDGAPAMPQVDGLVFGRPSQSSETSMVNFKVSRRFVLTYPVRPSKRSTISIPAFTVQTDKGALRIASASYSVGDATVGNSGLALTDVSSAKLNAPKTTFWAGEVFPLAYELSVIKRYFHSPASNIDWQPAPLVVEDWSKPEPSETMLKGERRFLVTQTTRAYSKQPGTFTIKPAQQLVNLNVGTVGFGLFAQPSVEQRVLATDPLELTIKPLPAAAGDFSGAVGNFALVSKVVPTSPAVGEPVTWTLELTGVGNWPDLSGLPQREVSSDFSVVQPKSKRTMKDNSLFEGSLTEDVVLVPNRPGTYKLGSVKFTYFDTASGTYKTITTEPVTITVGPAVAAPLAPQTNGPVQFSLPPAGNNAAPALKLPDPVAPTPPENLPRDPLTESRRGVAPMHTDRLVVLCLLSAALIPLLAWLTLAALRSRALDPQRRRREARAALAGVLDRMRTVGPDSAARNAQLRLWQLHTAALWEIPHAAPGAPLVHTAIAARAKDAAGAWSALWAEADRAQHSRDTALPTDWPLRAEGALQAVRVPAWPLLSLFAPRHLLPFLFVVFVAFVPALARAADAPADYKAGRFTTAESAWRKAAAADLRDWTLRHNLGLALAQQDRWAEATAHWTAAFLLAPTDADTRADLALGLQRSGMAPPELVEFSHGEGRYALARAASPGTWQLALIGAALLIAAALVLLLLKGYRRVGYWARPTALSVVILAIILAAAATLSLRTYGQLAHPDAVMVWRPSTLRSLPTDADTQKTTALSAGSIATIDKTFLGWSRLNFPGGQTGWARTDDLVRLYR